MKDSHNDIIDAISYHSYPGMVARELDEMIQSVS
jgi:molybdopterin synthase catalytic subunit